LKGLVGPNVSLLPVIKSEAYGHGLVPVAKTLAFEGVYGFGLSDLEEVLRLREAGLALPVILLSGFEPAWLPELIRLRVIPVVTDLYQLRLLADFVRRQRRKVALHLKVDTGMHRLGLTERELKEALSILHSSRELTLAGVMSHLAAGESPRSTLTKSQKKAFVRAVKEIQERGFRPRFLHLANSAALILDPSTHYNLVRPGLALFGVHPTGQTRQKVSLTPVMTYKARVLSVKEVPRGASIGYGPLYRAPKAMKIALVPVGYDDGYLRALSNKGFAWIKGERVPVVGAVSMRCVAFDVTQVEVSPGDEIILLGGKEAQVPAEELAQRSGLIPYELLCLLGRRANKIYLRAR
jgi:alanine racemase